MKAALLFFCFFASCVSISLTGCTYRYTAQTAGLIAQNTELRPRHNVRRMRAVSLSAGDRFCLLPITDDDEAFQKTFNQQAFEALQVRFAQVVMLANEESQSRAIDAAKTQSCSVLLYPIVVSKEDKFWSMADWGSFRKTESDVGMDRLQLQYTVWDVNTATLLDMAVVTSRSAWLDLVSSHSRDLIGASIDQYLQQLVAIP